MRTHASTSEPSIRLMNGTVLTYERAHAFMAFYGQQFALGKPTIRIDTLPHKPGSLAIMTFGESRMSYGSGSTDGAAKRDCYLKGAHKVESFDPEIWKLFVADETAKAQTTQERPAAAPARTSARSRKLPASPLVHRTVERRNPSPYDLNVRVDAALIESIHACSTSCISHISHLTLMYNICPVRSFVRLELV
ncbi:hypothetical protein AB1N83_010966 [Pleurotus pulmonarius]